jgi:hypothetical protein
MSGGDQSAGSPAITTALTPTPTVDTCVRARR